MLDFLQRLIDALSENLRDEAPSTPVPSPSTTNPMYSSLGENYFGLFPKGYQATLRDYDAAGRPDYFDPALKQYQHAYRLGAPRFCEPEILRAWYETRSAVMHYVLRQIANSAWKDSLVLRGSLLLQAWLGAHARPPGDLDWVFRPATVGSHDLQAEKLFADLVLMVKPTLHVGKTEINIDRIGLDDIWTYERASGRRLTFSWEVNGLPPGDLQIDVVFHEDLLTDPEEVKVPAPDGTHSVVWGASKELSLAWKLQWLQNDSYPQGKDLYDATLLAEQTYLPLVLLRQVLPEMEDYLHGEFPLEWCVEWEEFKAEYPHIDGRELDWKRRLVAALAPTFQETSTN